MKRFYWLLPFLVLSYQAFSQIDQEFWFVAPDISHTHGDRPICIRIATMSDDANVSLEMPANAGFTTMNQYILPNSVFTFWLTPWIDIIENRPADDVLNCGLHLTSDKQITAYYEVLGDNLNPGIFSLKGKNALGTEFYIVSQNDYVNHLNYTDDFETFEIVATEDNTIVTITPTDDIIGHPANSTFQITLNRGETYSARSTHQQAANTLAGSYIVSNKPIAVTWSDDSIETGGWDVVGDQTIPVNLLGREYIAIKGFADNTPADNDERVYILATKPNTEIYIDGGTTSVATLQSGEFYDYAIPSSNNTALVNASKPVYVLHLSGHPGEAGGSILPQDSCTGSRQIGFNRTNNLNFALMILTRTGNEGGFTLNGSTSLITASDFSTVPGSNGEWVYARKTMNTGQVPVGQNIIVNSLGKFHLGILNMLGGSSEYGYFSDFSSLYLGSDHSTCPNITTTLDGGAGMTTYEWKKNMWDGTWMTVGTTRYYTLADSGMYSCMTNGDFCTLFDTIHIRYYSVIPVNLGPDQTKCMGQTVTLDAGPGHTQYSWNTGETTQSIIVSATGTYSVVATDNNGCTATDAINVTFDPLPVPTISGNLEVCSGSTNNIYGTESGMTGYQWSISAGGTITAGGTPGDNSVTVTWDFPNSSPNDRWISLSYTNAYGCTPSTPTMAIVTVKPVPNVIATPPSPLILCSGTNVSVALSSTIPGTIGLTDFTWTAVCIPPGAVTGFTQNSLPGVVAINDLLTNVTNAPSTVNYLITPHANGCAGTVTPLNITVNPNAHVTNPDPPPLCSRNVFYMDLTMDVSGPVNPYFEWSASCIPANTVTGLPTGVITGSVITDFLVNITNNPATVTYLVTPYANGCAGTQRIYTFILNPSPTPIITSGSGSNGICQFNTDTYSTQTGMTNYIWSVSPGGTVLSGGTTTSSSVTVRWDLAVPQQIAVNYTNSNGCDAPSPTLFDVTVNPPPVSTFTGSTTVCQLHPDPYLYPANSGPACSYSWSITPPSAGSIANATVSPASITWNIPGPATLRLDAITGFGCTSFSSQAITINPRPNVAITPCFDLVTSRSAKRFLLKGGTPLLTSTPLQGEYLSNPLTPALIFDGSNYFFDPSLVPGTQISTFYISYKYTSTQFGCPATSSPLTLTVYGINPPCGTSMTDYRDGTSYRTSLIGGKCWMMENLRYGSSLTPTTAAQTDNCVVEKYCLSTDPSCTSYGGLYQWDELIQYGVTTPPEYQGVCPPGWHIPTAADYQALINANQGNSLAGAVLTDFNLNPRGFEALLNGMFYLNTSWAFLANNLPRGTMFWTSTPGSGNKIVTRGMNFPNYSVSYYESSKANAFPARCVKD